LAWDGDKNWVFNAKECLPQKYINLRKLIILTLRKPWDFIDKNKENIIDSMVEGKDSLSTNELLSLLGVISKVASMCSISNALKLANEDVPCSDKSL